MKVICIKKDKWEWASGKRAEPDKDPAFGEVVTVIEKMDHPSGTPIYRLEGYLYWYNSAHFVPLSDIDETELIKEREDSKVGFS